MSQNLPEVERITFFSGQQLTAADLNALQNANREMRWLHNRSLHRWGIALGLDVTGQRGDSTVTITPGYAVDCLGREIILTETVTKTVPAVGGVTNGGAASFYLVAAYQADANQKVLARRPGACMTEGAVRLTEEPLIDWRKPEQLLEGYELILAQASILNCQLSQPLAPGARRYARPAHQAFIAAGQTAAKATVWQPWEMDDQRIGVFTEVDTSAAHFTTTPRYVAHIVGARTLTESPGPLLAFCVPSVEWTSPTGFTLQVLLPKFSNMPQINPDSLIEETHIISDLLGWQVVWMGIEG